MYRCMETGLTVQLPELAKSKRASISQGGPQDLPTPLRVSMLLHARMAREGQHVIAWLDGRRVLVLSEKKRGFELDEVDQELFPVLSENKGGIICDDPSCKRLDNTTST